MRLLLVDVVKGANLADVDNAASKLMDVGLLNRAGWSANTSLEEGLRPAYAEFSAIGVAMSA